MASFNKVILMGNLTHDPELKQTPSGVSVTSFNIAVNRRYQKSTQEGAQTVDFFTVVCWRNTAEFVCRYFRKGQSIVVCGELQTRKYTDRSGVERTAVEVVADEASFGAPKAESEQPQKAEAAPYNPYRPADEQLQFGQTYSSPQLEELHDDEDLPF